MRFRIILRFLQHHQGQSELPERQQVWRRNSRGDGIVEPVPSQTSRNSEAFEFRKHHRIAIPSIAKHDHVQRLRVQLITCFFRMCSQWISHHFPFAQHFSTRYIIISQFLVPCFPPTTAASATT